jgi:ribose/xylose/arabinose/galactoside ABC-type transport system permease subunit
LSRLSFLRGIFLRRLSGLIAAIVVTMIVFTSINAFFLTPINLIGLVRSMSTFTIVAFGETLVLVSGELDLSVGATYGIAAMSFGLLWMHGTPLAVALAAGLLVGVLIGAINAWITTVIRVPSFITTLGMLSLVQGVSFLISNSQSINPPSKLPGYSVFEALGSLELPFGIPIQIAWLAVVAAIIAFLLHGTLFGFRLAAIGGNLQAARVAALPIRRYKFWVFAIAGACAALAGILDFSFIGSTTPNAGANLTFPVFAAVIIGGASLSGGRGTVLGTLIGAFFLSLLSNGLSLLGVGTFAQLIFVGLVTIGAVALDRWTTAWGGQSQSLQL